MSKIFLQVPFSQKDEAKELGAKWDKEEKEWYFEGEELPKELDRWTKTDILVTPEDKDFLKLSLPSLKWNKKLYKWECSKEDHLKQVPAH